MIVFSSGNMTVMGATSRFNSLNRLLDMKIARNFSCINVRITNIVCTCHFPPVNLKEFYLHWPIYCFYEPRLFPGCTIKIPGTGMKVNVFATGKVVVSGGSSLDVIESSLEFVNDLFKKFHDIKKET
jgi:TATA-box binding protein (TBP) (component of TFIID and TFIIIB)